MYKEWIRPALFKTDPEKIHRQLIKKMAFFEHSTMIQRLIEKIYTPHRCDLSVILDGMLFRNPIGLSAGFDKNAEVFQTLGSFGFGFVEVGTVTTQPQAGNPKPRIFRLPADDALISRTGFNNDGIEKILPRLQKPRSSSLIVGVNINKNDNTVGDAIIEEFKLLFERLYPYVDYFTINLTYPTEGTLKDPASGVLTEIFRSLVRFRENQNSYHPIYIKVSTDLTEPQLIDVGETLIRAQLDGIIAGGPSMTRDGFKHSSIEEIASCGNGGVSGAPIYEKSLNAVRFLRNRFDDQMTIIGAGGIMSGKEAQEMITAGADLIQIYSAFIYTGPHIVRQIGDTLCQNN